MWSSSDGIKWESKPKADWEERISFPRVFFKGRLLAMGGLIYQTSTMANDVWASEDGFTWKKVRDHAEWSPRKGHELVEFNNRLWLIGGATSVDQYKSGKDFVNDVWVSDNGMNWNVVTTNGGWPAIDNPRVIVFQNKMWLISGGGLENVWNSTDGETWTKIGKPNWAPRWDNGVEVYDNKLWVYGGREANPRNAFNDVWTSDDGIDWRLEQEHAPWTPRSGGNSVVFKDQLWIFAGKHTGSTHNWNKDIWVMGKK